MGTKVIIANHKHLTTGVCSGGRNVAAFLELTPAENKNTEKMGSHRMGPIDIGVPNNWEII